mmetsp:Transcript_4216/g.10705  ORF Transcript_4216/g.10705 Transcript_4216/m.10705 type:complete len:295 (+) Transcript_4216:102-986(+)
MLDTASPAAAPAPAQAAQTAPAAPAPATSEAAQRAVWALPFFRRCKVLETEELVPAAERRFAAKRLRFELPEGVALGVDGAKAEVVKIRRGLRMKSYCVVTDPDAKGYFDVVVRVFSNRNGVSAMLGQLKAGDTADVAIWGPLWYKSSKEMTRTPLVGMVAFGVGITKILPALQQRLKEDGVERIIVLWQNTSPGDRPLLRGDEVALEKLAASDKVVVRHIYSRERGNEQEGDLFGRIDRAILGNVFAEFADRKSDASFLCVGSKPAMFKTQADLKFLGYRKVKFFGRARMAKV